MGLLSWDLIKGDSGIMWWDEAAPRKVNVKLSIVGRKKEFIHKFDLVFETDEVECWRDVAKLAGHQLRQRQESDRHLTSKEWARNKFQPIVLFNRYGGEMSQEDLHEQCPPKGEIWVNACAKISGEICRSQNPWRLSGAESKHQAGKQRKERRKER